MMTQSRNKFEILKVGAILLAFSAGGCATATYVEPAEPAPASWIGASGYKMSKNAWTVTAGRHGIASAFAVNQLENIRTAVLDAPVTFDDVSRLGYTSKKKTLPAGTPLYARQYTQTVTTSYGGRPTYSRTQSASRNPIEWCAEGSEQTGAGWTCIFWQKPDVAYFASSSLGHPQSPNIGSDGSRGPMPTIRETNDVKFNSEFNIGLVVSGLRKKDATVSLIAGGEIEGKWKGNATSFQRKDWDENDRINLNMAGGEFILTAIRPEPGKTPEAVDVQVVKPPTISSTGSLTPEQKRQLLLLLLSGANQAEDVK